MTQDTPIDRESVERLARRIQTRAPYKSAMQIACEENISQTDAETVGAVIVFLGQGDYPTIQQIADQATRSANEAADTLLALAAERDRLRAALDEAEADQKALEYQTERLRLTMESGERALDRAEAAEAERDRLARILGE